MGRAALAVADEAEKGVASRLEVERDDVGDRRVAFQRRGNQVVGLGAAVLEVDFDFAGGEFVGFKAVLALMGRDGGRAIPGARAN